jgi:hypothetical protein
VLLPENVATDRNTVARAQRNRRTQFLFVYAYVVQLLFMSILSRQNWAPAAARGGSAAAAAAGAAGRVRSARGALPK